MVSKYYLSRVVLWTLTISITALVSALLWAGDRKPGTLIIGVAILAIEVLLFVRSMNVVNRKISSFLDALKNQDTSIKLPDDDPDGILGELYSALNHVVSIFQDLKIEYAAREQLFLSMIEHSSTGFISIDANGDFEIMNKTARELLGATYTSNLSRLGQDMPELHALITTLQPGEVKRCKVERKEGLLVIQVALARLKYLNKEYILLSFQDIKKEIDATEMESWLKLIRIMNHEIMNSIAPITSVSKSLKPIFIRSDHPVEPAEIDSEDIADAISGLEIIESMSSGLKHFVSQYQKLSRVPDPVIEPINVGAWSEKIRHLGSELIHEGNTLLSITVDKGVSEILADEILLNQVMLNLIRNAVEAPCVNKKKNIKVLISQSEDGNSTIRVVNDGEPITKEIQDQIFIPFFTTKEKGDGIGLFLSRQIIYMHKGKLEVYTNKDLETVFEIVL
jgi:nitrogen fixation/metabolism regulation signal transduction histidine kinase